jgi:hypothetical protein
MTLDHAPAAEPESSAPRYQTDPSLPEFGTPRIARRIAFTLLIVVQLGTALALGGVFGEAIGTAAGLLLLAFGVSVYRAHSVSIDGIGILLLGLTAATAFQLIPLPLSVVAGLSPRTADTALGAAAALGEAAPTSAPLSIDPAATGVMLVWMLAVTAGYLVARRLAERGSMREWMVLAVPTFGLVLVAIGLVHAVLGLDRVYGLYAPNPNALPIRTGALYLSTFISPNHLAGFLNLGAPVALVVATSDSVTQRQRILWGLAGVVLIAGVVMTGSRAGTLCAGLGALLVIVSRGQSVGRVMTLFGLAVASLLVLASPIGEQLASLPGLSELVESTDRGIRTLTFDVIQAWPWAGVGRGAFGVAQTQVNSLVTGFTVTYAHNTPLQVIADFGVLVGGGALVAGAMLMVRPMLAAFKVPLYRGAAIGLLSVLLQNLVDFSLDILGVALVAVAFVAAIRAGGPGVTFAWKVPAAASLLLAAMMPWLMARVGPEPGPRRDAVIATDPVAAARNLPGDAYAFFEAGVITRSLPLLGHARQLAPFEPRVPLAQAALSRGSDRLPLLRAALSSPESWRIRPQAFELLRRTARSSADLAVALPDGQLAAAYLATMKPPRPAVTDAILRAFPESIAVLEAIAAAALTAKDWKSLDDVATRLMALESPSGFRYLAEVYRHDRRDYEAYELYLSAGDAESTLTAAELAISAGDTKRALKIADRAKVSAKHLKRLKSIQTRAKALNATSEPVDMRLRFQAELPKVPPGLGTRPAEPAPAPQKTPPP